jgi:DtxR family Mn-dependent transcriptional regulator
MSEEVERRLVEVLGHPTESPYGNPIPGLAELGERDQGVEFRRGLVALSAVPGDTRRVIVRRIGEPIQSDPDLLLRLWQAGVRPNTPIPVARVEGGVLLGTEPDAAEFDDLVASHVFVAEA